MEEQHNTFINTFEKGRYSFYLFISKLKDEKDVVRIISIQKTKLNVIFKRKRIYFDREAKLFLRKTRECNYGCEFIFSVIKVLNY